MKIIKLETFVCRIPYKRVEASSVINRGGITDVVVKITGDNGIVGWGECTRAADVAGIESAVKAMAPLVIGRDPWDKEAIHRDLALHALWALQPMTGNFAFAGIDMALWDLCGKQCGQPLYRLFGGALREEIDYFYYMEWGSPEEIARQAADGVERGYRVYYIKVGVDEKREEAMLEALRHVIGPDGLIRIDANQAWSLPRAVRILKRWHLRFDLDFAEAPVRIDPVENMLDLRRQIDVPLCVNEGLWRGADAYRVIKSRCGDYLCFSPYWVGSFGHFHTLAHVGHLEGWQICKHTHGEFGLAAAAFHHLMIAAPNACVGHQQTAQLMEDDILAQRLPISDGPRWGRIDEPGLGVEVDEAKLRKYDAAYRKYGEFPTYIDKTKAAKE
ncbi:MAG TPA: mandelate racemase/muconate lactonizing enzyme family protein [Alphaproteobacteria bacterium]|nr:mandelate racemase/muconate lactonizing enzyme family protein [Alphaproteobacteria bacterium]